MLYFTTNGGDKMENSEKIIRGKKLAQILKLKFHYAYAEDDENIRYDTSWGSKTALGLYETVNRVLNDERLEYLKNL